MKRVMIIGQSGSGKSTLARNLGKITGLPVVHMDKIQWKSGWLERTIEEREELVANVHASDSWIFEGGFSRTYPERIARADTCIWLDLPLGIRLWRVFIRTLRDYGKSRPDLPEGCPEQFNWEFFSWIISSRHKNRIAPQAIMDNPPEHLTAHHLQSVKEVQAFLTNIKLN